jgi:hypothetical protein
MKDVPAVRIVRMSRCRVGSGSTSRPLHSGNVFHTSGPQESRVGHGGDWPEIRRRELRLRQTSLRSGSLPRPCASRSPRALRARLQLSQPVKTKKGPPCGRPFFSFWWRRRPSHWIWNQCVVLQISEIPPGIPPAAVSDRLVHSKLAPLLPRVRAGLFSRHSGFGSASEFSTLRPGTRANSRRDRSRRADSWELLAGRGRLSRRSRSRHRRSEALNPRGGRANAGSLGRDAKRSRPDAAAWRRGRRKGLCNSRER